MAASARLRGVDRILVLAAIAKSSRASFFGRHCTSDSSARSSTPERDAAMARLVDPGGYLLLRVPLADSWASRHFGPDWVQLDAPRHLQLPTRKSIEILAHNCGLHVEHVEDDSGSFQIWGSLLYRRGHSLAEAGRGGRRKLSLFRRLTARWQARRLSRAGLGDQACFYLRRN